MPNAKSKTRMHLELPARAREKIEELGRGTDQNMTEVVRRAISLYGRIGAALTAGDRLIIRSGDRETEVLLPEFDAALPKTTEPTA